MTTGIDTVEGGGAVLSRCGRYRYTLERRWERAPRYVMWLMLNPSTADATKNDATIRRCVGFAKSWGYGGILVGNLYALRATQPSELWSAASTAAQPSADPAYVAGGPDPIGPDNDVHLVQLFRRASIIVCAWGQRGPYPSRRWDVLRTLLWAEFAKEREPSRLHYLTLNGNGEPGHPLRLRGDLQPTFWDVLREAREAGP